MRMPWPIGPRRALHVCAHGRAANACARCAALCTGGGAQRLFLLAMKYMTILILSIYQFPDVELKIFIFRGFACLHEWSLFVVSGDQHNQYICHHVIL